MFKSAGKALFVFAAVALAGCGDDTYSLIGAPGTDGGDDDGGVTPATLTLVADSTQLSSDASTSAQGVVLTAIVKDAANNVVPDADVAFSSTSGAMGPIDTAAGLVTDASGQVQAFLHTGGDPSNRTITVTARSGSARDTVTIVVVGTSLAISGPDSTQFNVPTEYTVQLTSGGGSGISGRTVSIQSNPGNTISASSLETDAGGRVTFTLTATVAETTITATALGVSAEKEVVVSTDQFEFTSPTVNEEVALGATKTISLRWLRSGAPVNGETVNFAATRGTLSSSTATTSGGVASVTISSNFSGFSKITATGSGPSALQASRTLEFVATTPATIEVQASPSAISTNQTSEIRAIVRDANQNLVKNQTVEFEVVQDESNGSLDAASVVTDSLGSAKTTYRATSATSGFDGVLIRGTVAGSISDTTSLTVGSRSARIVVGTGSQILIKDESTYQLPFTVVVTDQNGSATPDADVTISVLPYSFYKGFFPSEEDPGFTALCPNEDIDFDTINDPGEDVDGDGILEPGNVAAAPTSVELEEDGSGQFLLTYPKDVGLFVTVDVIARVIAEGTETTSRRRILLTVAESEVENLPGVSPFGVVGDCADPE